MKLIKEKETEYRCTCGKIVSTSETKSKCPVCGKKMKPSKGEENHRIKRQIRFRTAVIAVICIVAIVANTIVLAVSALGV